MTDVLERIERELVGAAGRRIGRSRARRRALALAASLVIGLAAASVASGVTGQGPLGGLFGVSDDDPTLRSAQPVPGGQRARVEATSSSGQRVVFGIFETRGAFGLPPGPSHRAGSGYCFTPLFRGAKRVPGLGCAPASGFLKQIERRGLFAEAFGGASHGETTGVVATHPVYGLIPADARRVTVRASGIGPQEANLSAPFRLNVRPTRSKKVRAFLAVVDSPGDVNLTGFTTLTAQVHLADGSVKRRRLEVAVGFPLVHTSRPERGSHRIRMHDTARRTPWELIAYEGSERALCSSAAPRGERLLSLLRLQCSSPLAVIDGLHRSGVAAYPSDTQPPGGTNKPGSYTVFGYTRLDARQVVITDQKGRRWRAVLSHVWTSAVRRSDDLRGVEGPLRERLDRLPSAVRVRSFFVAIPAPPDASDGPGLSIETRLADGRTLKQP